MLILKLFACVLSLVAEFIPETRNIKQAGHVSIGIFYILNIYNDN